MADTGTFTCLGDGDEGGATSKCREEDVYRPIGAAMMRRK